jgi:hypothetical protein
MSVSTFVEELRKEKRAFNRKLNTVEKQELQRHLQETPGELSEYEEDLAMAIQINEDAFNIIISHLTTRFGLENIQGVIRGAVENFTIDNDHVDHACPIVLLVSRLAKEQSLVDGTYGTCSECTTATCLPSNNEVDLENMYEDGEIYRLLRPLELKLYGKIGQLRNRHRDELLQLEANNAQELQAARTILRRKRSGERKSNVGDNI